MSWSVAVNKTFLSLLGGLFVAFAAISAPAHAASANGDYVRMNVPDVRQALDFLHEAMNCSVISSTLDGPKPDAGSTAQAALMNCGYGVIVELADVAHAPPARQTSAKHGADAVVEFRSVDAVSTAAWLRSKGATVISAPTRIVVGPNAGRIVVDVVAPWGQPLRLVSWSTANPPRLRPVGDGLAAQ
jgi:hypothetical protein